MSSSYRDLEKLVAEIQKELAPEAEVLHDQKLPGLKTGRSRQIDVLVRQQVGQYDIKIIIECKDYKRPADVKAVEAFYGLFDDVAAHKGVLVCPAGFTKTAKTRADGLQIDLYSPIDTEPHKWQVRPEIPAICDFRSAMISFGFRTASRCRWRLPQNFITELVAFDEAGNELGTPITAAVEKWNAGGFPDELGKHVKQPIYPTMEVIVDNGFGELMRADIYAGLNVSRELYFGQVPITKISGFKDELRGDVITNVFEVGMLSPDDVAKNWLLVESEDQAPVHPVIGMIGRVSWVE